MRAYTVKKEGNILKEGKRKEKKRKICALTYLNTYIRNKPHKRSEGKKIKTGSLYTKRSEFLCATLHRIRNLTKKKERKLEKS